MRTLLVSGILLFSFFSGCAVRQPTQMQTKFDYEIHKQYAQNGTSSINGQGFLRQHGGGVVTCAGSPVLLIPATSFFTEYINLVKDGKDPQTSEGLDPTYKNVLKESQCDAQGNFSFTNIPQGNWFIMTEVKWNVNYNQQGGTLLRQIAVSNGDTQVLLTDSDFAGR